MKTIRLLYPDHQSGGLDTYYFGAHLLSHLLPENPDQALITVDVRPPDGTEKAVNNGIYAEEEVLWGIKDAQSKLAQARPDKIITIGGNCLVSLAPFDYLHGLYHNTVRLDHCFDGCALLLACGAFPRLCHVRRLFGYTGRVLLTAGLFACFLAIGRGSWRAL